MGPYLCNLVLGLTSIRVGLWSIASDTGKAAQRVSACSQMRYAASPSGTFMLGGLIYGEVMQWEDNVKYGDRI